MAAFTNGGFGDSSLFFVTDYHPLSETLAQKHFASSPRYQNRNQTVHVKEQVLLGYMVQIANALKAIHDENLAARVIDPSKVLLTSENRVRLNACGIMDVVQHDTALSTQELQREDLEKFGKLILAVGTNTPAAMNNMLAIPKAMELFSRAYPNLRDSILWLLDSTDKTASIQTFITMISMNVMTAFDSTLHFDDQLNSELNRELENSRIVRLMTKLNFINERPEYEQDQQWSEYGERYYLKLFRDYVFHQVDAHGNPVLDLHHVLSCVNKLDVGVDERITLTSRDEQSCYVVSYRELKKGVEGAFGDLMKAARRGA